MSPQTHPAIALPTLIGHRGYSARAPENTLAAVREAHRAGIQWVEIDVQLLGDGTPVIWHDRDVSRCSNGTARLARLDWESAAQLDAGAWFGKKLEERLGDESGDRFNERFRGERMATLTEMLALLNALEMGVNLELKLNPGHDPMALARRVIPETLAALPAERRIVSSFSRPALDVAREMAPPAELALGALFKRLPRRWQRHCAELQAFSVHLDWRYITRQQLTALRLAGYEVVGYTANHPAAFAPLWQWGISSVISDDPVAFMASA